MDSPLELATAATLELADLLARSEADETVPDATVRQRVAYAARACGRVRTPSVRHLSRLRRFNLMTPAGGRACDTRRGHASPLLGEHDSRARGLPLHGRTFVYSTGSADAIQTSNLEGDQDGEFPCLKNAQPNDGFALFSDRSVVAMRVNGDSRILRPQ